MSNGTGQYKYVDGVLVELTQAEVDQIEAEQSAAEPKSASEPDDEPAHKRGEPAHHKRGTHGHRAK